MSLRAAGGGSGGRQHLGGDQCCGQCQVDKHLLPCPGGRWWHEGAHRQHQSQGQRHGQCDDRGTQHRQCHGGNHERQNGVDEGVGQVSMHQQGHAHRRCQQSPEERGGAQRSQRADPLPVDHHTQRQGRCAADHGTGHPGQYGGIQGLFQTACDHHRPEQCAGRRCHHASQNHQ